jgi:hypothetical protein
VKSTSLFGTANNLEMFNMQFGASLVFKVFSNFAFKNNFDKKDFDLNGL